MLCACDGPRLAWSYRFDDADLRARTAVVEATIREGGCEGAPVHEQVFARDEAAMTPPPLPGGEYGLEIVARDAECRVIGRVCEAVEIGAAGERVLVVAPVTDGAACEGDEVCEAGRCAPGGDGGAPDGGPPDDGGVPCGCIDEGGACQAGTAIGACGAGGGRCEVCCGGGVDTCDSGRCVPLESRRVREVSAGHEHTCVLLETGEPYCWGSNDDGQLAAGDATSSLEPVQIGSAADWTVIHGAHSTICGSRRSGGLRCWGWNFAGQVGTGVADPPRIASEQFLDVPEELVEIEADRFHVCGRTAGGTLYCWGSNGLFALWRDTTGTYAPSEVIEPDGVPTEWDALRVGLHRTCALADGEQWCAGYGSHGRIGVAEAELVAERNSRLLETPTRVAPEIAWSELTVGVAHTCGLDADRRLYCWGCGAKCDPDVQDCDPMNVDSNSDLRDCSFALGRLPETGFFIESPVDGLVDDGPFLAITASEHTCAILDDGGGDGAGPLVCFGPNDHGQLGDGTTTARGFDRAAAVLDGARFTAVSAGTRHTCAIRDTGALYCWGYGDDRALGTTDLQPADPSAHEARMRESATRPRRACFD